MRDIDLVNRAFSAIGILPIQSMDEPGPGGENIVTTYKAVTDYNLGANLWTFAKSFKSLSRLSETPLMGWRYNFMLPPDRLEMPRAYFDSTQDGRPLHQIEVLEDKVQSNTEVLYAEYICKPPVYKYPASFSELMRVSLAAEFALQIREDEGLHQRLYQRAYGTPRENGQGGLMATAVERDGQARPSPDLYANNMTINRHGDYDPDDMRHGWG